MSLVWALTVNGLFRGCEYIRVGLFNTRDLNSPCPVIRTVGNLSPGIPSMRKGCGTMSVGLRIVFTRSESRLELPPLRGHHDGAHRVHGSLIPGSLKLPRR